MTASQHTVEEKIEIIQAMDQGKSKRQLALTHHVSIRTLNRWREKYHRLGVWKVSNLPHSQ